MKCTLFGQYALNAFLASRGDQHVVVTLHYCNVKTFPSMSLSPIITNYYIYRNL